MRKPIKIATAILLLLLFMGILNWLCYNGYTTYFAVKRNVTDPLINNRFGIGKYLSSYDSTINLTGLIFLNLWTFVSTLYLIYRLQRLGRDHAEKPIIFLLQQNLIVQLISFATLDVFYIDLFLCPIIIKKILKGSVVGSCVFILTPFLLYQL